MAKNQTTALSFLAQQEIEQDRVNPKSCTLTNGPTTCVVLLQHFHVEHTDISLKCVYYS